MGFSRQECWSGLPCPSPGDLPNPGIEPGSPALHEYSLPSESPGKPQYIDDMLLIVFILFHLANVTYETGNPQTWRFESQYDIIHCL